MRWYYLFGNSLQVKAHYLHGKYEYSILFISVAPAGFCINRPGAFPAVIIMSPDPTVAGVPNGRNKGYGYELHNPAGVE